MAGRRFPLDKFPTLLKNPPPNVDIMLYDKRKREHHPGDNIVDKSNEGNMTLTKLAKIVVDGFNRVDMRISNLEKDVNSLKQDVKDINARIDRIDIRLDYIVKANNLKDSK